MDATSVRRIVEAVEPLLDATGMHLDPSHSDAEMADALRDVIVVLADAGHLPVR